MPKKSDLARQLKGHLELLQTAGVTQFPRKPRAKAAPAAATKAAPPPAIVQPAVAKPAAQRQIKPVIVASAGLAELKQYESERARKLEEMAEQVRVCARCLLCETRTQTVFGTGNPDSMLMIIGEAPGGDEDAKGIPFVGRAGVLLTDIIQKGMGYRREDVYIANVLKCRPPGNRNPEPAEIEACRNYLLKQIEIIDPKVILAVGRFPAQWLTKSNAPIGELRGKVFENDGRKVIATYHPAYVLRNYTVDTRKKVHEDVLKVVAILGKGNIVRS
ncbi:MAG: uracil-DNA glycosylase [Planctomycetes bacterium]|nr:uracil-DNA glycosylase [Planctomycetota bacterium]